MWAVRGAGYQKEQVASYLWGWSTGWYELSEVQTSMAMGVRVPSRQQARGWCAKEGQARAITVETAAGWVGNHKVGEITRVESR